MRVNTRRHSGSVQSVRKQIDRIWWITVDKNIWFAIFKCNGRASRTSRRRRLIQIRTIFYIQIFRPLEERENIRQNDKI